MGPQHGVPINSRDELGLEFSAAVMGPWDMDWEKLLGIVGLVCCCFVEKGGSGEFRADVLGERVVSAVVDVRIWKTTEDVLRNDAE